MYLSVCRGKPQGVKWHMLQHPMSKNIASGRFFTNPRARGYAGNLATLSPVNKNARMQKNGKSCTQNTILLSCVNAPSARATTYLVCLLL